ncbi:DNA-binding Lrp family transcriptional regulator [Alkalibacillus flavidus]|uniref:DNA-binding Lrp family transcriptional regulator n=1 Tax=Alkalibacillus flavidus TaxID=546021 RepID=A0ABV2KVP0_9BACI
MKLFAEETTYQRLSTFATLDGLNKAVRTHRANLADDLTPTQRDVLDVLARHSCTYKGVSFLRKNKLAELVGKSRRTVIYACNRLAELGVIEQHELRRPRGDRRQTVNAVVIQPAVQRDNDRHKADEKPAEKGDCTPELHTEETPQKTIKLPNHNIEDTGADSAPATALAHAIPAPVFNALKPFFNANELYEVYGVLLRAKAQINREIMLEDHGERYAQVFQNIIRKFKRGKVRNLTGMLFVSWRELTAEIDREIAKIGEVYYDWVNTDDSGAEDGGAAYFDWLADYYDGKGAMI